MFISRLLRTVVKIGIRELAENPELRTKASSMVRNKILPEAKAQWSRAKPGIERARNRAKVAVKDATSKHSLAVNSKKIIFDAYQKLRNSTKC